MNRKIVAIVPTLTILLCGCAGGKTIPVESISISESEISVPVGQKYKVDAIITPDNATNKSFTWDSENYDVCYVLGGSITGVSVGETYVTATTKDGGKTAKCLVHVTEKEPEVVHVTGVVVNKPSIEMEVGESEKITATVVPSDASNKNVSWSVVSNPENAISVNNGVITANEIGNGVVSVTTEDGEFTAMTTVTVKGEEKKKVTGVLLDKESIKVAIGKESTLTATVLPIDATDKEVSWSVEDPNIAAVKDGVVSGVSVGNTVVTVTTHDGGFTKSCAVEVIEAPVEQGVTMHLVSDGEAKDIKLEKSKTGVDEYYISYVFKENDYFTFETNDGQKLDARDLKPTSSNRFSRYDVGNNSILALTSASTEVYVELSNESSAERGIYLAENHDIRVHRSSDASFEKTLTYNVQTDVYYLNALACVPGEKFEFLIKDGTKLNFAVDNTNYDKTSGVKAGSSDTTIDIGISWNATISSYEIFVTGLETNRQLSLTRKEKEMFYVLVSQQGSSREEFKAINLKLEAGDVIKPAWQLGTYQFNILGGGAAGNFKLEDGLVKVKENCGGSYDCYLVSNDSSPTDYNEIYIEFHN